MRSETPSNNSSRIPLTLGKNYQIFLVKRQRRKTVGLIVEDENTVVVHHPPRISRRKLIDIIEKSHDWIEKKRKIIADRPQPKAYQFVHNERLPYFGKDIYLQLKTGPKKKPQLHLDQLIIQASERQLSDKVWVREQIKKWYKTVGREIIEDRVHIWSQYIQKKPQQIRLKDTKTRWGSCSSMGNLNFNWKLLMAPLDILDYVVVHELCHLHHPNHSKAFWALVQQIYPQYRYGHNWLRENGHLLTI